MVKTKFKFNHNNYNKLNIILPGANGGIELSIIDKILDLSYKKGYSSLSINYPFYERAESRSSKNFREEIENIQDILNLINYNEYRQIKFIGKSLGGIISSYYLSQIDKKDIKKYSLVVLGYDIGYIDLSTFTGDIQIIQGEFDRFGNIEKVKKDIKDKDAESKNIIYNEIKGADHSYRNYQTGELDFEDYAISLINF